MSNMRGLAVFISDLRNARAREAEERRVNTELAKIRSKFRESKLSGYDRKKYICKLLYMYILGWNIDFGHLETVALVSSTKYSEKQIGYLGITLLLNEHHDLLQLVVNSIKKDLLHSNELYNCLALHCIANVGGKELGTALSHDVHQLLVSSSSKSFVKKKAALTLLRLYRKDSSIIDIQWAPRIISLLDDPDLGVTLSLTSLIIDLAVDAPDVYAEGYQRAVHKLRSIVFQNSCSADDRYYHVPCPWLQIKLMRFLLLYPAPMDTLLLSSLTDVLEHIMDTNEPSIKNVQQNNAQHAVLFQAIDLAIHIGLKHDFSEKIMLLLSSFLGSKETNVRYLGLETLSRLTRQVGLLDSMRHHHLDVSHALKDRDVSVRRRALDLSYSLCHVGNAKDTIQGLLRYLQVSDHSIKEELVLKIAVLIEKYATEYEWYLDITLQLLSTAGEFVADEVWQRVVQIVTNNEGLQEYAARSIMLYLKSSSCHENVVKVGSLILGEYGHLIANESFCSPIEQFSVLHSKFGSSKQATRAMLLSTYLKFLNVFPEIAIELSLVFEHLQSILDVELHQRACEYLAITQMPKHDLLQAICEEMPPYSNSKSKLISKLYTSEEDDKRRTQAVVSMGNSDPLGKALSTSTTSKTPTISTHAAGPRVYLSPNWEEGFRRLAWKDNGVLYEDAQLRVLIRTIYDKHTGLMTIIFDNKTSATFGAFSTSLIPGGPNLGRTQQTFELNCDQIFSEAPNLRITYLAGSLQEVILKLPIFLTKFLAPADEMKEDTFNVRWEQLESIQLQSVRVLDQSIFGTMELHRASGNLKKILEGYRWAIWQDMPVVRGAAVLHIHNAKSIGCLMEIEASPDMATMRISIRSSTPRVSEILQENVALNLLALN